MTEVIVNCKVCIGVDPMDLIGLDSIMGDPAAWPATIWGPIFKPPKAANLPASYRRFGAVEMGMAWLAEKGIPMARRDVRRHYRFDVPKIGTNPDELVQNGLLRRGRASEGRMAVRIDPIAYLSYYNTGIQVGLEGLSLLAERIEKLKSDDKEVPIALIKMAIDSGAKLATSQASIVASGKQWGGDGDEDEAFRANTDGPLPSDRMGHTRVRVIEGQARPVADEGPADREAYSDRAAQEGGIELPHR